MSFWSRSHDPMEDFQTKNWQHLSETDKLSRLQFLEDSMAHEQGRPSRQVTPYAGDDCGFYSRNEPDKIFINDDYLRSAEPGVQYDAMNTVIHEGRHAYQHDCVEGKIHHSETNQTVVMWGKNNEIYNQPDADFLRYRFQPVEIDANDIAEQKMKSLQGYYSNDANYQKYIESINAARLEDITIAQGRFGLNYQQNIEDKICSDYEWNHRYIPTPEEQDKALIQLCDYANQTYGDDWCSNWRQYVNTDPEFRNLYQTAFPYDRLPPMTDSPGAASRTMPTNLWLDNDPPSSPSQFNPGDFIPTPSANHIGNGIGNGIT